MRSPFKLSALFLASALAMGLAGQAYALDVGDKGAFAQMEETLRQEQQTEVGRATYVLHREDPVRMKILTIKFTVNAASGDAYILLSDGTNDQQAKTEIVYGKLKNARIYDPHNVGVLPQGVVVDSNLGDFIKRAASTGDGLMLHGQSVKKQADGTEQVTGLVTVLANLSNKQDINYSDRVVIFNTLISNTTTLDKVVAYDVRYRGIPAK